MLHVVDLIRGHYQLYDDNDDNEISIGSLAADIQLLMNFYFHFRCWFLVYFLYCIDKLTPHHGNKDFNTQTSDHPV